VFSSALLALRVSSRRSRAGPSHTIHYTASSPRSASLKRWGCQSARATCAHAFPNELNRTSRPCKTCATTCGACIYVAQRRRRAFHNPALEDQPKLSPASPYAPAGFSLVGAPRHPPHAQPHLAHDLRLPRPYPDYYRPLLHRARDDHHLSRPRRPDRSSSGPSAATTQLRRDL